MLSMFFDGSGEFSGTLKNSGHGPNIFGRVFGQSTKYFRAEQKKSGRARKFPGTFSGTCPEFFRARAQKIFGHNFRALPYFFRAQFSGTFSGKFFGRIFFRVDLFPSTFFVISGRAEIVFLCITFLNKHWTLYSGTIFEHRFRAP